LENKHLIDIKDLRVSFFTPGGEVQAVRGISWFLDEGEALGIVGESGSGKSVSVYAIMRLLQSPGRVVGGSISFNGVDILGLSEPEMRNIRGNDIAMIFQDPMTSLNPVYTVGDQICEPLKLHLKMNNEDAMKRAEELLGMVGIPSPKRRLKQYPFEFSGGMRQRAMISMALACEPKLLIADEPTTALDVTIQAQILQLLMDLRTSRGLSVIMITHDLGIVAQTCDRIAVLRQGQLLEIGDKREILARPQHSYTQNLIASHPSMPERQALAPVGAHPSLTLQKTRPLIEVDDLYVRFPVAGRPLFSVGPREFAAVKGISLQVMPGETVGIVGESGSGKSTLARALLGLTPISDGHVTFDGADIVTDRRKALAKLRRETAMVFQDPYNALNPRLTIGSMLAEVLAVQESVPKDRIPDRIGELLDLVGLEREFADRKPLSMSGGQCQRAGIARALAVNPKLIVADECVAALDVTIQAQIVDLFRDLKERLNLTLLFIAHDLAIVRNLCERVVVMYHGAIVEEGPTDKVFTAPREAYTRALIGAIPDIDPDKPLLSPPGGDSLDEETSALVAGDA